MPTPDQMMADYDPERAKRDLERIDRLFAGAPVKLSPLVVPPWDVAADDAALAQQQAEEDALFARAIAQPDKP